MAYIIEVCMKCDSDAIEVTHERLDKPEERRLEVKIIRKCLVCGHENVGHFSALKQEYWEK